MKRITLLFCLLTVSFGYAQTDVIESFDGDAPTVVAEGGCTPGTATVSDEQATTGANSLKIITSAAASPWQGQELVLQNESLDLTTNKTIFVDVYSTVPAGILAKVTEGGDDGTSAAGHGGTGWETLEFNMDDQSDGATSADGIYTNLIIYPLWGADLGVAYDGQGTTECQSTNPITIYIDNIVGTSGAGAETCFDGILNNGEEQIDCGGPNCAPCATLPTEAAPTPPPSNAAGVRSIFSDAYTDIPDVNWNPDFGPNLEVSDIVANDDNLKTFDGPGFVGVDWSANRFDGETMTNFHIDFWITDPSLSDKTFSFKLINLGAGTETQELNAFEYTLSNGDVPENYNVNGDQWMSVDIPFSAFNRIPQAGQDPNAVDGLGQFVITSNFAGAIYVDNVYLYNPALSTEEFSATNFRVYPNPTTTNWNIESNTTINAITVYDILGKQVRTLTPNASEVEISTSNITAGIYFARIDGINGSKTVKLIKE